MRLSQAKNNFFIIILAMPKQRTRKSAAKRFKVTSGGKVLHRSHKIRHLRSKKTRRQLRSLLQMKEVKGTLKSKVKRMLGVK